MLKKKQIYVLCFDPNSKWNLALFNANTISLVHSQTQFFTVMIDQECNPMTAVQLCITLDPYPAAGNIKVIFKGVYIIITECSSLLLPVGGLQ